MTRPLDTTKPLRLAEAKAGLDRLRRKERAKQVKALRVLLTKRS